MSTLVSKKDEIIMRLVHYFITEENYEPIVVNGVKNEIWLENMDAPYRIIRINSNYIHNDYQLKVDKFKIKNITKQIKKKTLTFKMKTLNILLDVNSDVKTDNEKDISIYKVDSLKDVRKDDGLASIFPRLKTMTLKKEDNLNLIVNITNDINSKTEKENKEYENVFKPKKIVITNILITVNVVMYLLCIIFPDITNALILNVNAVKSGEYYRLITNAFLHANIIHLLFNMYALYIIGNQVETFIGKWKYLAIYLISGFTCSLLSCALVSVDSLGASGAIFGLMGCLLYFGYHYRLYLGSVLLSQIIPIILINLVIGFTTPGINNAGHIGGLVGGIFSTMAIGIGKKEDKTSRINGIITLLIFIIFLVYLVFFKN